MKVTAFLLALLVIFFTGVSGFRSLQKTTVFPIWWALYRAHFPVDREKISGNFEQGFKIDSLREESDDLEVRLEGIELQFSAKDFSELEFLSIAQVSIQVKDGSSLSLRSLSAIKSTDIVKCFPKLTSNLKIANLEIAKVDIANAGGEKANVIDRISIQNLRLDHVQNSFTAKRVWFSSSLVIGDFHDLEMEERELSFNSESFLQINPQVDPEFLKNPVDLRFLGVMDGGSPSKMTVTAFSTRLTINFRGDNWRVTLSDFSPDQFFKFDKWFPVANISLTAAGPVDLGVSALSLDGQRGSLILGRAAFDFHALPSGGMFKRIQGRKKYSLKLRAPTDLRSALKGNQPLAVLGSSEPGLVRDILAGIFYDKALTQLSVDQKQNLDSVVKYFADAPGAHPLVPHLALLGKHDQLRQPTSQTTRNRGGADDSSALPPRELPPYRGPQHH